MLKVHEFGIVLFFAVGGIRYTMYLQHLTNKLIKKTTHAVFTSHAAGVTISSLSLCLYALARAVGAYPADSTFFVYASAAALACIAMNVHAYHFKPTSRAQPFTTPVVLTVAQYTWYAARIPHHTIGSAVCLCGGVAILAATAVIAVRALLVSSAPGGGRVISYFKK
jgi:hypothetical protein